MGGQAEPTSRSMKEWGWAVGLTLLLLASGAGVFRGFSPEKVDHGEAVRRAAIGALVGLVLAGLLIGAWAWYRKRTGIAAGALGASLLAALIAFLVAALATVGASTAPPAATSQPGHNGDASSSTESNNKSSGEGTEVKPYGGALDMDTGRVYVDTDGDGVVDTELVECPPPSPPTIDAVSTLGGAPSTTLPPYRVGDKVRVIIDNECDGVVDEIIYVDVRDRVQIGGTPTSTAPHDNANNSKPDDNNSNDNENDGSGSSAIGTILIVLLILGAVIGLVVAIRALARTQAAKPAPVPPTPDQQEPTINTAAAAEFLAESGRILVDDPDPRRAIIAAYGTLLTGLEEAGAGRRPFEAPEEHLQRSLRELRIPPEALAEVTRLFLVAKFSTHPLGESERQQARKALGEAERHLRHLIQARSTELR